MLAAKLRHEIALEAARLLLAWQQAHFEKAKWHAARRLCRGPVAPRDMPTNREVRDRLRQLTLDDESSGRSRGHRPEAPLDRFVLYRGLLEPLERIKLDPRRFPEGDLLYHSLQVFELVRAERHYDEELLSAALLHEVGQAIDTQDPLGAALANLDGAITERVAWLLVNQPHAQAHREGSLGARGRRRLEEADDFEDVLLLADCDRRAHVRGAVVPDLDEALAYLRELERDQAGDA